MANNDKLREVISNLQILSDLSNSMIDSEMYPVSFFSQAFDLIQKIQSNIHTLEADQVELFASQMKKHQALILSIHQQMRNISPESQDQKPESETVATQTVPVPAPDIDKKQPTPTSAANEVQKPETAETGEHEPEIPKQKDESPKKTSFLSRLGRSKDDKEKKTDENAIVPALSTETTDKKPVTPPPAILENPISVPEVKQIEEEPDSEPEIEKSEIRIPEKPVQIERVQTNTHVKDVIQPSRPVPNQTQKEKNTPAEVTKTANDSYAEKVANGNKSLNDTIEKNKLADLRKAFSLNDRFRYRKELFAGNEEVMNKVITILNNKTSFKDSMTFLEEKLHWDFSNPTIKDFVKVIELRFL